MFYLSRPTFYKFKTKKSRNFYHTCINISVLFFPKIVILTTSFFHNKIFMSDWAAILGNRMSFCIAFWQQRWFSVMGSLGCAYDGGKVCMSVMGMDGNQDKCFHWILMVAMVQCYGFTEVCVWRGKTYGRVVGEGWELGWVFVSIEYWWWWWFSVIGLLRCAYNGGKIYRRGRGQEWGGVEYSKFLFLFINGVI